MAEQDRHPEEWLEAGDWFHEGGSSNFRIPRLIIRGINRGYQPTTPQIWEAMTEEDIPTYDAQDATPDTHYFPHESGITPIGDR